MRNLWVDDERLPPDWQNGADIPESFWNYAKTASAAFFRLNKEGTPTTVSLDHDLGEEKTGLDVLRFLLNEEDGVLKPDCIIVHTQNVVGRTNMIAEAMAAGYKQVGTTDLSAVGASSISMVLER